MSRCKIETYKYIEIPINKDYIKFTIDLKKERNRKEIRRLNLLFRNEECNCNVCKPDTSNRILEYDK